MIPISARSCLNTHAIEPDLANHNTVNHRHCVGPCQDRPADVRCAICILDSSDYFSGLSLDAKSALQRIMRLQYLDRRETLCSEGGACNNIALLMSGSLKMYKSLGGGRQQIHRLVSVPGDMLGCEDLYSDRLSSTIQALADTVLCVMDKSDFNEVVARHPEISDTLMRTMARNLKAYIHHAANLGQKLVIERVASYLIYLHETHKKRGLQTEQLAETLSRAELADMLGTTQRTLIRSLKKLEQDELIILNRQGFKILDHAYLLRLADGECT